MRNIATSSGLLSGAATTAVYAVGPCQLNSVLAISDGTNACTVTVYDNASAASGKVLAKIITGTSGSLQFVPPTAVSALNGLTVVVAGSGTPQAVISFIPG